MLQGVVLTSIYLEAFLSVHAFSCFVYTGAWKYNCSTNEITIIGDPNILRKTIKELFCAEYEF